MLSTESLLGPQRDPTLAARALFGPDLARHQPALQLIGFGKRLPDNNRGRVNIEGEIDGTLQTTSRPLRAVSPILMRNAGQECSGRLPEAAISVYSKRLRQEANMPKIAHRSPLAADFSPWRPPPGAAHSRRRRRPDPLFPNRPTRLGVDHCR